jgi:hypothetical protein
MRLPTLLVSLLVTNLVAVPTSAQTPTDTLTALDARWARAYFEHDTTFALALFAEDLVVTAGAGTLKDRAGELADIREAPGFVVHFFRTTDVRVRLHEKSAVVVGLAEWSFTFNGRTPTNRRRYTATYVRGGPLGWRMVALHLGPAPEPRP